MPRKILIIVENLPVPFDARVWNEACSLQANGYGVTVPCPKDQTHKRGYDYLDGIHIYRHPTVGEGNSTLRYL